MGCGEGWGGEGLWGHEWLEGECGHWVLVGLGRWEGGGGAWEVVVLLRRLRRR